MQSADAGEGCGRESSFSVEIAEVLLEYWPHTDFPPPTRLVYFPRLDRKIVKLPSNCVLSAHSVCIYLFKYIYIYMFYIQTYFFLRFAPVPSCQRIHKCCRKISYSRNPPDSQSPFP